MPEPFELRSEVLGPLPVINHFLARMGLGEVVARHLYLVTTPACGSRRRR